MDMGKEEIIRRLKDVIAGSEYGADDGAVEAAIKLLSEPQQHQKIKGYRDLSAEDIALMNKVKELGPILEEHIAEVNNYVHNQRVQAVSHEGARERAVAVGRLDRADPEQWTRLAREHFQQGLMALTRAVAQPLFF